MRHAITSLLLAIAARDAIAQGDTLRRASVKTFEAVAASIGQMNKGEFETTAAFRERLRARLDTSLIVIELEPSTVSVKYDADSGRFWIRPAMRWPETSVPAAAYPAVTAREISATRGTHRASNALGATTDVVDRVEDRWVVASTIPAVGADGPVTRLYVAPGPARTLKPALRFYVAGRLAIGPGDDPSGLLLDIDTATFSSPIETKNVTHLLWMDGPEFDVVDARTHRILARVGY